METKIFWKLQSVYLYIPLIFVFDFSITSGKHSQERKVRQEERHRKNIKVREIL